jgi:uncharacterized protein YbjQ (UPF0145 family)
MKKLTLLLIPAVFFTLISVSTVSARDTLAQLPLKNALENEKVRSSISNSIPLYWGDQRHPAVVKEFGKFPTSKRTSIGGKSDAEACEWALASAIVALQDRARREGGNAIINIKSNIKNQPHSSTTTFDCLQGGMMVNVALEGTVVTLGK